MDWLEGADRLRSGRAGPLQRVRGTPGLITTVHEATHRVAAHGVRERLLEHQAAACGLPLIKVPIPDPCLADIRE